MQKLTAGLFRWITGKTDEELAREWAFHYFCTRSRVRAFLRLLAYRQGA